MTAARVLPGRSGDTGTTAMVAAGAAVVVGAGLVATATDDGVVLCPVRRCTGGYCPGCGGTRAARQLIAGDVGGAWSHNPWVVLVALQVVVVGAVLASIGPVRRHWRPLVVPLALANAGVGLGIWAIRLFAGSIPSPF